MTSSAHKPSHSRSTRTARPSTKTRTSYSCPIYSLKLVRERTVRYKPSIDDQFDAARAVLRMLAGNADREHFVVLFLDSQNTLIGASVTAIGALAAISAITIRETFKAAIVASAAAIVVGHNHPSGLVKPSREDDETTKRLVVASKIIGIPLLDHVIVGGDAKPFSFHAEGRLD